MIAGVLVIILAASSAYFFYMESDRESKKTDSLKKEIAVITEERITSLKKINKIKQQKEKLTSDLQDYSIKIQNKEVEISGIKKVKEDLLTQFQEKKEALSDLQQVLEDVKLEESGLKDDLSKVKEDREDVLQALESMQRKKSALEDKIKSYLKGSQSVELRKIVVKMAGPVEGNIIDVNKEYNFAVINLGSMDKIKNGDLLGIYRDGRLIAKAVIENVYEDMSSIIVFDEWRNAEIFYGDKVKLLKN